MNVILGNTSINSENSMTEWYLIGVLRLFQHYLSHFEMTDER